MELRASPEAASFAVTEELPNILWNPNAPSTGPYPESCEFCPQRPIAARPILILFTHVLSELLVSFLLTFLAITYMRSSNFSETCIRRNRMGPKIFSTLDKFPHYTK
jgi:hypothetical protein